jgi:kinesin family protein 18/19
MLLFKWLLLHLDIELLSEVVPSIFIYCCMCLYSGKTYTMVGSHNDPGLMVLSFRTIFDQIKKDDSSDTFEVSCSYLEVYNEVMCNILC